MKLIVRPDELLVHLQSGALLSPLLVLFLLFFFFFFCFIIIFFNVQINLFTDGVFVRNFIISSQLCFGRRVGHKTRAVKR